MPDAEIRMFPGRTWTLFHPWRDVEVIHEPTVLGTALDALDAFCPAILVPLAAELELECVDTYGTHPSELIFPENLDWLLQTELPPEVELNLLTSGHVQRKAPALTRQVIAGWVEEALREPLPEGADHVAWSWLSLAAARVRVFEPERFAGRETMEVQSERGYREVPLERDMSGLWITTPVRSFSTQPAVSLRFERLHVGLLLKVNVQWSPWLNEGAPGRAAVDAARARLLKCGWQQDPNA